MRTGAEGYLNEEYWETTCTLVGFAFIKAEYMDPLQPTPPFIQVQGLRHILIGILHLL